MPTSLVLIAQPKSAQKAIAAWQRVLPEDDLIRDVQISQASWKGDLLYAVHTLRTEYIQELREIIDETIPAAEPHLVNTF